MARRRGSRKIALDVLYEREVGGRPLSEILARHSGATAADYASKLVEGVDAHLGEIDVLLTRYAEDWAIERMPLIDRNLLRIGIYEILHAPDVPVAVIIDEAVELAKRYSTEESGRFINGVLARIADEVRGAGV
ncbi:MAG: transcription antitermination factor NusB [Actinomycetota bacterium]